MCGSADVIAIDRSRFNPDYVTSAKIQVVYEEGNLPFKFRGN